MPQTTFAKSPIETKTTKVRISCGACGARGAVPKRFAGRRIRCLSCKQTLRVPIAGWESNRLQKVHHYHQATPLAVGPGEERHDLRLEDVRLDHLGAMVDKLAQIGITVEEDDEESVRVRRTGPLRPVDLTTLPYPGYPTDLQAQIVTLLTRAEGISVVTEKVYPDRFMHLAELNRMGADIHKEGPSAIIRGVERLKGTDVMASDLRAGAALVLAGLVAEGRTVVHRVYHIDRGYESMEQKLRAVGATIHREQAQTQAAKAA